MVRGRPGVPTVNVFPRRYASGLLPSRRTASVCELRAARVRLPSSPAIELVQDLNGGRERQADANRKAVRGRPRTVKVRRIVTLKRCSNAKLGRAQERQRGCAPARSLPVFRGRRFPCTGCHRCGPALGRRLLGTTVYVNSILRRGHGLGAPRPNIAHFNAGAYSPGSAPPSGGTSPFSISSSGRARGPAR